MSNILTLFPDDFPDDLDKSLLVATHKDGGLKIFDLTEISYQNYRKFQDSQNWKCREITAEEVIEVFKNAD